ncbi:MAG: EAL domain-containing protein [Methylococcaceae bacterium]|nr:EAL domain-containing protein [Methylococcaceae bacterium]
MRVLIIDDDPLTQRLIRETLSPDDFEIIEAENTEDSIMQALEKSPDLVLLDVVMPCMDGFACFNALREHLPSGRGVTLPVVMLTEMNNNTSIEYSFAMGATDFIHKPIDCSLLAHRLRFVMRAHRLTKALQISEERLRLSMRAAHQGFYDLDIRTGRAIVNEEYATMLGYDPVTFEETRDSWLERLHPDDRKAVKKTCRAYLAGELPEYRIEYRLACANGTWKWILSVGNIVERDSSGAPLRMLGTHTDIDYLKQNEDRLNLLAKVFENSGEGIMLCDATNKIVQVNQSFTNITGYLSEEVIGKSPKLLSSGNHDVAFYDRMWCTINETGYWQGEIWDKRKNGEVFPMLLGISTVRGAYDKLTHYIAVFSDITEHKAAESKIEYLAHHDPLTNLPNRTLLRDRFDQAIARAARNHSLVALLFLDLDHFKQINDTLGHDMGDRLLQAIATRLVQCLRDVDTICRQGGDEFIIVLTDLLDMDRVVQITQKILFHLHEPFVINGLRISTSFSIGVCTYPTDGVNFLGLLNKADTAMYAAKKQGRNTFRFFSDEMNIASIERINLENGLRNAFEKGELSLHYQPQYAINGHQMLGAEALLRWEKSAGEWIAPNTFIPVAEEIGLIVPIGHWVLHEACRQNQRWHDNGATLTVTVNVSAVQFKQGNLVQSVRSALASSGLEPRYLELELTETTLMQNTEMVVEVMTELRKLGVKFAIDDFGSGYSSLNCLKLFIVDNLKIDASFINELSSGRAKDRSIVQAIIQLGQTLNIKVLAEGVETESQLKQLQQLGCDKVQGFYLNYPLSVEQFEREVLLLSKKQSAEK